ncbi:MAG: glycosyltransferase family 4 protein [Acidobacteriota bacterium]|nr:glycosyltransferase family 4 protein [Acidobacteriota bacterium]
MDVRFYVVSNLTDFVVSNLTDFKYPALKILQISSAQSLGGGERHLADLANGLALRGHEVHAALRPNSPLISELEKIPKENIITFPLRNALDAKSARDLSRLVRKNQIQIVHAHMARDYPLAAYAVRINKDAQLIVTRHVLFPLNRLHRIMLSKAARIIAVSHAVALRLREDGTVPAEKINVVQNGIDDERFGRTKAKFSRRQFLHSWELPENSLIIGTVGELTPLKGQDEFVQAAGRIIKHYPNAYFVIAGIGSSRENKYRALLEHQIKKLNLTQRVRLVGWFEDIAQLYCALDVFVSASHTESFGLAIAEAMASNTAVVATETAGAREIIRSGETGLLVPVGDIDKLAEAVLILLREKEKRISIAAAAQRAVSEQFSLKRMIDETERIYTEALKT